MDKSYWIKTDGTQEQVIPKNGNDFQLEELNKFVGGHIEIVTLKNNKFMVVNEEGKLHDLPYNDTATKLLVHTLPSTTDYIVGNILVCDQSLIE